MSFIKINLICLWILAVGLSVLVLQGARIDKLQLELDEGHTEVLEGLTENMSGVIEILGDWNRRIK